KTGGHAKPMILDKVDIELKDFSRASIMPFSLNAKLNGGGDVKIDGKAGPLQDNIELTPMNATIKMTHIDLLASGAVDPATGIAGLAALDGSIESDGKKVSTKGKLTAEQVRLVKGGSPAASPLEFDFAAHHDLATRAGALTQGDVHVGKAKAAFTGTYL